MKTIKKIIDKTSDVLSFPARRKARNMIRRGSKLVEDLKIVRASKGAEPMTDDYRDPLFKARVNVSNAKFDIEERKKKEAKKLARKAKRRNRRGTSDGGMVK